MSKNKQVNAIIRFWGEDALSKEQVEETKRRYEEVKSNYRTRKCPECGRAEMSVAWSPVALPDMAEAVGLGKFVPLAYYEPLLHAHPSLEGMLRRLEQLPEDDGAFSYGDRLNRSLSDQVLMTAHGLVISVIEAQVNHFTLDEGPFSELAGDFKYVWEKEAVEPPAATANE